MHPLEPKRHLSQIMEYAIWDTAKMNRETEYLRYTMDFTEGKKLLLKIKDVIVANTGLIQSIDYYIFNLKNQKATELQAIRSNLIRNLSQSCLEKLEPNQEDVQKHEDLRVQMKAKLQEIFALWRQCLGIEQLTEDLLAELDDAIALRDAIAFDLYGAEDWREEPIELGKPRRKLSRSC